jgi:hypothetical protein
MDPNPLNAVVIPSVWHDELVDVKKYWYASVLLVALCLLFYFWILPMVENPQIFLIPFFAIVAFIYYISRKAEGQFMKQVGTALGYTYFDSAPMTSVMGTLFSFGHGQTLSFVLSGQYATLPVRIYYYSTTVGSGKNSHTYTFTVFEITYPYDMPHVILCKKEGFWTSLSEGNYHSFPGGEMTTLEGNFSKYFSLCGEKGLETETYEIFTPDVMQTILDKTPKVNFELCKNKLYVYTLEAVSKKEDMVSLYDGAITLLQSLSTHFKEVSADTDAMTKEHSTLSGVRL